MTYMDEATRLARLVIDNQLDFNDATHRLFQFTEGGYTIFGARDILIKEITAQLRVRAVYRVAQQALPTYHAWMDRWIGG